MHNLKLAYNDTTRYFYAFYQTRIVHFYLQQELSLELLQQRLESNIELFCVQAVKIHSKLDMIDIEQIMLEEGLTIPDDCFMGTAERPVSDLTFAKVEP